MDKIAVLGDRDSVLGFRLLGAAVFPAETAEEARRIFRDLARGGWAVICLTEGYAAARAEEIDRYRDASAPAVVLIPGREGTLGAGAAQITRAVERAVGADIL